MTTATAATHLELLPARMSPSRALDMRQCPRLYYYKTLCKLPDPPSADAAVGTLAHAALERIFDHPAGTRTADLAITYLAPAWQEMTAAADNADLPDDDRDKVHAREYRAIAAAGSEDEAQLLVRAEAHVRSWFDMERANNFTPIDLELPNGERIDGREFYAIAQAGNATVHGYIDRVDRWTTRDGRVHWSITDYKTGKAPGEGKNYRPETLERIVFEKFFQLRVYAVALKHAHGIEVSVLRLVFTKYGNGDGIVTLPMSEAIYRRTLAEIEGIWQGLQSAARQKNWPPRPGPLCDWCSFNDICPQFNPHLADMQPQPRGAA